MKKIRLAKKNLKNKRMSFNKIKNKFNGDATTLFPSTQITKLKIFFLKIQLENPNNIK